MNLMNHATAITCAVFTMAGCASIDGAAGGCGKGEADNPTPQVRIITPVDRSTVNGSEVVIRIETRNFKFDYDKASVPPGTESRLPGKYGELCQQANTGHVHVYLAPYDSQDTPNPNRFLMPKFFMVREFGMPNAAEFSLREVKPGNYRLLVELVAHDHTPRLKRHPRDWPSIDLISLAVQ